MSSIVISGDTSGAITLAAPAVSGTNTATLPAATGTVMVSGNMPGFSAYNNATQSVSNATFTKISLQTTEWNNGNYFDNSTNYRFTPLVAGYYQVNGSISNNSSIGVTVSFIYKNGSRFKDGNYASGTTIGTDSTVSALIYLNGSTDYIELWVYANTGTGATISSSSTGTFFQAQLVRAS